MALFSCGKEATVDPVFVENSFFVENTETATAKVLEFLNYTDFTETTLRSDYPDTEVNEGLWTLEASGNYLDNVNLALKSDITINYTLSVTNIIDNGILKMSGADMTDKFNQLQASITAEEANGKTAKIVDFELGSVSNQQTDLVIDVVYSASPPPPNVVGCEDWPASESIWSADEPLTACLLSHTINYTWYQTVSIFGFDEVVICSPSGPNHIWEIDGQTVEPDEFDASYAAVQETVDCLILDVYGPLLPNTTHVHGPPLLVDIDLAFDSLSPSTSFVFVFEVVLGRGVPY